MQWGYAAKSSGHTIQEDDLRLSKTESEKYPNIEMQTNRDDTNMLTSNPDETQVLCSDKKVGCRKEETEKGSEGKLEPDGQLPWMKKLSKNKSLSNPNETQKIPVTPNVRPHTLPIPGLHTGVEVKDCSDKNLAPLSLSCPKTFQFGDTSIISTTTSDKDWAPGECLNLCKYEGRFVVKKCSNTQQVIHFED